MQQLLQNVTILLQNATVITKCDVYYKMVRHKIITFRYSLGLDIVENKETFELFIRFVLICFIFTVQHF